MQRAVHLVRATDNDTFYEDLGVVFQVDGQECAEEENALLEKH